MEEIRLVSRQGTIPLKGSGCTGSLHLTGSKEEVERFMALLVEHVRNTLHAEWMENRIPENAKPSPCRGCGN